MEVCRTVSGIVDFHNRHREKVIGFVPTMGALHEGHASLIQAALEQCEVVVCSIFVNPIQFNNPNDLATYPRHEEEDLDMLRNLGCHLAFLPDEDEVYPHKPMESYDFNGMDKVMEGAFRPGHFSGVAAVVRRLFEIVKPHKAYFGEKDFQQLAIVRQLTEKLHFDIDIVGCPTIREKSGLAKSSRNERLNPEEKEQATLLFQSLQRAKELAKKQEVASVKQKIQQLYSNQADVKLEYFELVNTRTLQPVAEWNVKEGVTACVAAHVGQVRLIDNMVLIP